MPISSINRVKTIALNLRQNSDTIFTIYSNNDLTVGSDLQSGYKIVSVNCFVKNLKAFVDIKSLEEISLPNFEIDDTDTQKLLKTLDVEWNSPRKQLTLYLSNSEVWSKVGSVSLLNPSGYPYRIHNLMDLFTDNLAVELGDSGKIGIQVEDVGFGLLTSTDLVAIHGSYLEEIFVSSPDHIFTPSTGTPVTPPTPPTTEDNEMTNWLLKATDYTAKVGEKVLAMAEANIVTVSLPINPPVGTIVKVAKYAIKSSESRNNLVINLNGAFLDGAQPTTTFLLEIGAIIEFIYIDATIGWSYFISSTNPTILYT